MPPSAFCERARHKQKRAHLGSFYFLRRDHLDSSVVEVQPRVPDRIVTECRVVPRIDASAFMLHQRGQLVATVDRLDAGRR